MDDLISRKRAIEAIEKHLRIADEVYLLTDTEKTMNHAFEIAASCVYNLQSAQQWIPCSERLPEEDEFVLVTFCWFSRKDDLAVNIDHIRDGEWAISESVVAWMPLPEPYREETES